LELKEIFHPAKPLATLPNAWDPWGTREWLFLSFNINEAIFLALSRRLHANNARDNFMAKRIEQLRKAKSGNWAAKLQLGSASRRRPGAVGNYYMRFQFSNDPVFVLTKHPDRDVRMTAWLTVLTSLFAIVMEIFPLNLGNEEAVLARRARTEASAVMLPRADEPIEITNPDH
jgi:hypothetical protein